MDRDFIIRGTHLNDKDLRSCLSLNQPVKRDIASPKGPRKWTRVNLVW